MNENNGCPTYDCFISRLLLAYGQSNEIKSNAHSMKFLMKNLILIKFFVFQAHEILRNSTQKSELLFREFGVNYYNEPDVFRKGTTLIRKLIASVKDNKLRQYIIPLYCDLMGEEFWKENPEIVGLKSLQVCHRTIHSNIFVVNRPNNLCDKNDNDSSLKMEMSH